MNKLINWYKTSLANPTYCASLGLLILRVVAGLALAQHGWGKMQSPMHWMGPTAPVPGFFQFLAAFSEFGGGIAWVLGLLFPIASFGIACTMAVAVSVHCSMGDPWIAHEMGKGSFEPALGYFAVAIFMLLSGPGQLSLDRKLFK